MHQILRRDESLIMETEMRTMFCPQISPHNTSKEEPKNPKRPNPILSAQYVTLQKYFSHSSLVIYFFGNHLEQHFVMGQSETLGSSQIIFITLSFLSFCMCNSVAAPFTSHHKLPNYVEPKPFS